MRLVVDSNIVFAALLRDGVARSLLVEPPFELLCPEWMLVEIRSHREEIARRGRLMPEELDALLSLVSERLEIVRADEYAATMKDAELRIRNRDAGDIPFLALALSHRCDGIWTHNTKHFAECGVDLWTTAKVLDWVRTHSKA